MRQGKSSWTLCACVLALASLVPPATAQVYRWVDDAGQVHYSDKRPTDAERQASDAQSVTFAPGSTAAAAARQAEQRAAQASEVQAERCQQARSQLDTYTRAVSLVRTGPDGQDVELLPEERVALIQRAQDKVAAACGDDAG